MKLPNFALLPLIDTCLIVQSFFLNFLWIILVWGWVAARKRHPEQTLSGGVPGYFHLAVALVVWAVTLGAAVREFDPVYWFLGFAIANGAFLSILNPAFALTFSLSMLLIRPWEIMPNNELILEIPRFSILFSMAWALFYFLVIDRFSLRLSRATVLLLAFAVWVFLSTFVTPVPADARNAFNETMLRAVTIFYLIFHLARDRFSVWALKACLITIFTCVGLIAIIFYFNNYRDDGRIIAFGIFENTNDIAAVMTLMLPLAAAPFFAQSKGRLEKSFALIPISIALVVLALAQSRGAVLSIAAAVGTYAYFKIQRKSLAVGAIVGLVLCGQVATLAFHRAEGDLEGSTASRKSFWISGIRMAIYNPVFGVGFGQFPSSFETYATEIVGEFGKRTAHSSWILALAETGPVGLILFAAFFFDGAMLGAYRLYREDPSWLYAVASYGIAMTFLSHTYTLFPYLLVALISVAGQAKASSERAAEPRRRLAA